MVGEPKRISLTSSAVGVSTQTNARFGPGTGSILRRLVNYHNIWASLIVEPIDADANSHGSWILWFKADTNTTDPVYNNANITGGDLNMTIIACGLWAASNQTPYVMQPMQLKTSRNLVANQELVMSCFISGQTAGLSRVVISLCAGLSVK